MDALIRPTATPVRQHGDDRRLAWLEILGDLLPGDLTVTTVYPGAKLGWHRHWHQDDYMLVVAGTLKVGCWRDVETDIEGMAERDVVWRTLDARHPETYRIPADWWHGYCAIGGEATALTYITQRYTPADEARMSPTLTPDIVWTAADWADHPGAVRIDQSPADTVPDYAADVQDFEHELAHVLDGMSDGYFDGRVNGVLVHPWSQELQDTYYSEKSTYNRICMSNAAETFACETTRTGRVK